MPVNSIVIDEKCEAVDISVLRAFEEERAEGEPDLVVELIDLYLYDTSQRVAAIKWALGLEDENSLKRFAHALKGSSANLGARRVASLCDGIERLDFADSFENCRALVESLELELERVRQLFTAERQRRIIRG